VGHSLRIALGEQTIVGDADYVPDNAVKSAARVLQILELFDVLRREALVSEVTELLDFPQSSTSVLLRSMVTMGYMHYNRETRAYSPTTKVALLGNWVNSPLVGNGVLVQLMYRLNQRTGQAIILAARNQTVAEYIHVVQATSAARLFVVKGARRSLIASSAGLAFISSLSDPDIKRIAVRINAEAKSPEEIVSLQWLMGRVQEVRRDGYCMTNSLVTPGGGMLSMKLPKTDGGEAFVIGIGAVNEVLLARKEEFVDIMREEIAAYSAGNVEAKDTASKP
jgi:DNA-binding IclR family transcriptional regulator